MPEFKHTGRFTVCYQIKEIKSSVSASSQPVPFEISYDNEDECKTLAWAMSRVVRHIALLHLSAPSHPHSPPPDLLKAAKNNQHIHIHPKNGNCNIWWNLGQLSSAFDMAHAWKPKFYIELQSWKPKNNNEEKCFIFKEAKVINYTAGI